MARRLSERSLNAPEPPYTPSNVPYPPGPSPEWGVTPPTNTIGDKISGIGSGTGTPGPTGPAIPVGGASSGFGSWGSMPNFAATDPARGQSDFTWGVLKGIASGEDVPFGPDQINSAKAQAKTASENTYNQAESEIRAQQAMTGFATSPGAARPLVDARIGASQQYGKASNDIVQAAAQQNFNARLEALRGAQTWIDSLRSYVSGMTGTFWQRQEAEAQLKLAEQRLQEQMREYDITTGLGATF